MSQHIDDYEDFREVDTAGEKDTAADIHPQQLIHLQLVQGMMQTTRKTDTSTSASCAAVRKVRQGR